MAKRGKRARRSKVALVCAGGGVTGALYEIGCLRALDDLLDRSVADLDLYVGVSGGAFVSSLLASGITPAEMYDAVTSPAGGALGVPDAPLYRLGLGDFFTASRRAPALLRRAAAAALRGETGTLTDLAWSVFELLPAGLLDNSGLQEYVEALLRSRGRKDRFDALRHPLLVVAVDLDDGEAVAFGDAAHRDVPVSRAVQASTALPGLYRPVRIGTRDFVDGGVKKTAHIHLAIDAGADLDPVRQSRRAHPQRRAGRPLQRPPERARHHLRAGPGAPDHAARPDAVRDGALPAGVSRKSTSFSWSPAAMTSACSATTS